MQRHYANQEPDENLVVALRWKWSWDEDRLGPAAWRHWWWSQAGLVSVDHDRAERWQLQRPDVRDIPCAFELLLSQASEFMSDYFLEGLSTLTCRCLCNVTWWIHVVCMLVLKKKNPHCIFLCVSYSMSIMLHIVMWLLCELVHLADTTFTFLAHKTKSP